MIRRTDPMILRAIFSVFCCGGDCMEDLLIMIMGSVLLIIFLIMIHYCLNSHCLP